MIDGHDPRRALHVLYHHVRSTWNEAPEMPGDGASRGVNPATRRIADNHGEGLALVVIRGLGAGAGVHTKEYAKEARQYVPGTPSSSHPVFLDNDSAGFFVVENTLAGYVCHASLSGWRLVTGP